MAPTDHFLGVLADAFWRDERYGPLFLAGAAPMFISFFLVAMLTHYEDWDPLMDFLRALGARRCLRSIEVDSGRTVESGQHEDNDDTLEREHLIPAHGGSSPPSSSPSVRIET